MIRFRNVIGILVLLLLGSGLGIAATGATGISQVKVSRAFFDPGLKQSVAVEMNLCCAGKLDVDVLDRDGFVVRHLVKEQSVKGGSHTETWDGRDDAGAVLPDDVFRFSMQLRSASGVVRYDPPWPASARMREPSNARYSKGTGTIGYTLKRASLVHMQVGIGRRDQKTKEFHGAVLANIVDHLPRPAGSVVEPWNGYIEGTGLYLPNHPDFSISLLATPLPENSVILSTHSVEKYADYAKKHRDAKDIEPRTLKMGTHQNHAGLNIFEDHSPAIALIPLNATSENGLWKVKEPLLIRIEAKEDLSYFLKQHPTLAIFIDHEAILQSIDDLPQEVTIPADKLPTGEHLVIVNYDSHFGPVGVAAIRVSAD